MQTSQNLYQVLHGVARSNPDWTAVLQSDGTRLSPISFRQIDSEVCAWASYFASRGVVCGDRVVAVSFKCTNHYRFFYACWRLGVIAVPVCETLTQVEMGFIIRDCSPKLVLSDKSHLSKVQECAGDYSVVQWDEIPANADAGALAALPVPTDTELVAALIYTSGSTGMPKGVMLTHHNIWYNTWSALQVYNITNKDRMLSLLPYWHAFALSCEMCATVMSGCAVIMAKDMRDFKRNLAAFQPTLLLVVPRVVDGLVASIKKRFSELPPRQRALVDKAIYNASRIYTAGPRLNGGILRMFTHHFFYDPLIFRNVRKQLGGKVRMIVSGGAPLDLEYQIFFKYLGMPLFQGYGLSEASPVVSANLFECHRLGSCGPVMPWLTPEHGGDFTFKDEDGTMGKDVHGQLLLKGPCVMKGYWNHSDASAKTFEDGWLNTGDVGHYDKDGFLFIHGRKGSMIVLGGGEKLHPEHIEDAIKTSDYVSEAMVIGEKCKNVYVVVNVSRVAAEKYSPEELHDLIKEDVLKKTEDIAAYQKPKNVLILPDFTIEDGTLTATFKIRRHKVMEKYRKEIEAFLVENGEEIATKHELGLASSRVVESLEEGTVIVGVDNVIK